MIDYMFGTQGVAVEKGSVEIQSTLKSDGSGDRCKPCLANPPCYPYDVYTAPVDDASSVTTITHGSDHSWVTATVALGCGWAGPKKS